MGYTQEWQYCIKQFVRVGAALQDNVFEEKNDFI